MFLQWIKIKGFRGLRDFEHNFESGKALLVYGLNGTGKSSLFQALNFVITGQFPSVSSVDISSPEIYRHKALDNKNNAYVSLTFNHNNNPYTIQREIKPNGKIITTTSDPEAIKICQDKKNHLCFLTKADFVSMVDTVERDSWQKITPFLGFDEIVNLREGLRALNHNIRKFLSLTQVEQSAQTDQTNLNEVKKKLNSCLSQLSLEKCTPEIIKSELQKILNETLTFQKYSEILWDELEKKLPGGERIKAISNELQGLTKENTVCQIPRLPSDKIKPTLEFLSDLHSNENLGHELLHFNFFTYAKSAVDKLTSEPCPLCGMTPEDWIKVREDLLYKIDKLEKTQNIFNEAKACLQLYLSSITTTINNINDLENHRNELIEFSNSLRIFKDFIDLGINKLDSKPVKGFSKEETCGFENARDQVNVSYQKLKNCLKDLESQLKQEQTKLADNPDLQLFYRLKEISNLHVEYIKAKLKHKESTKRVKVVSDIVNKVQSFYRLVDTAESELSTQLLIQLEAEFRRIFCILTDQEHLIPAIKLKTERSIRAAEIIINNFYGLGPVCAREYLSEANRNSIGLAIYFAGLLRRGPLLNTLFLDDITHSCDNNHRRGLASFIVNELSNLLQLIILTHDNGWHDRIFTTLTNSKCTSLKVIDWNLDGITYQADKWSSLLDKASEKILNHDHTGGNTLRQALEQLLNEMCERLKVTFPFRESTSQIQLNEKRQRLENAIRDAWGTGQGIIDPNSHAILLLLNSQQITNLASHYGSYDSWQYQDLMDALSDVKDLLNAFTCKNPHANSVCGSLLPRLKKVNGNMPTCSRCGSPFLII